MLIKRSTHFESIGRMRDPVRIAWLAMPIVACALLVAAFVREPIGAPEAGGGPASAAPSEAVAASAEAVAASAVDAADAPAAAEAALAAAVGPAAADLHQDVDDAVERERLRRAVAERAQPRNVAVGKLATPQQLAAGSGSSPRRQLSHEQMNVVRFISGKYRVAVDASSNFVYHAFKTARDMKVDPFLILAVMSVESSFNPLAQSGKGAQGLMQVLTRVHADRFLPFGGITAAFDPVANIRVGSTILKEYLEREGSVEGALKSYVGAALLAHDNGYGAKVLSERERIAAAASGRAAAADGAKATSRPAPMPAPDAALQQDIRRVSLGTASDDRSAEASVPQPEQLPGSAGGV